MPRSKPIVSRLPFTELLLDLESVIAQARRDDADADPRNRVYFIQESGIGAIKIGMSKHARKRATELQYSMPHTVVLLATVGGGCGVEHALHTLFAHAYIRNEWFRPVDELLEYINKEGELPEVTEARELKLLHDKVRNMRVIA